MRLFALSLVLCLTAGPLFAEEVPEVIEADHSKVVTLDATPMDPGEVELDLTYSILGGKFAWERDGKRVKRGGPFLVQSWDTETYIGLFKNVDVIIFQGFQHILDKQNNVNEFFGRRDPDTGEEMEDGTMGPSHGFGRSDLGITGRWRFFNSQEKQLEIAFTSAVFVPTGRRGNLDHIGPSQGFTSLDNTLILTKSIQRWDGTVSIGFNAPLAHMYRTDNYCGSLHTNVAVGYQVFTWWQPEIEVIYSHDFGKHEEHANLASIVVGCLFFVNDHVRLDTGIQQDVLGSSSEQTTAGIFRVALMT
jgi:hypothetical protein